MTDIQRQLAIFEKQLLSKNSAKIRFGVTVTKDNIELTVTVDDKKNTESVLDLNIIKSTINNYISSTNDNPNFDTMMNDIFDIISTMYPGRTVEVMIYDNIECLTVMKIFPTT